MTAHLVILRVTIFAIAIVTSIVTLALSVTVKDSLGIAASLLTATSLSAMYILDQLRGGVISAMIAFEIAWTFILWILWAAVAGLAVEVTQFCSYHSKDEKERCRMFTVTCALAFIVWIALLGYQITLTIYAVVASSRSRDVWTWSVQEATSTVVESTEYPYPSPKNKSSEHKNGVHDLPIQLPVDLPYESSFKSTSTCTVPTQPLYTHPGPSPRTAQSPTFRVGSPQSSYYFTQSPKRHHSMRSIFSSYTYRDKGLPSLPEDTNH
ncbi:hypothetical protein BJ138DRAFT_7025 [Hygrophoropsis aurantiaca]|uniref:Uncharacterized protein n=1 Tax=Hygrophoropsis aurantiaca TaxID=72124 RepID=A0ACB8AT23_9AGAM|nr:hypothetical protein BJ138DRAFT_7025 [Hygrophoropsis aurantiaca]